MSHRLERLALQRAVRMSTQRRAILQVLDAASGALSAREILLLAREVNRYVSSSTVHRTLRLLMKFKLLARVGPDQPVRYMKCPSEHREHLIDLRTGQVLEFRSDGIEALLEHSMTQLGYRLLDYRLELFGAATQTEDGPAAARSTAADCFVAPRRSRQHRH